MSQSVSTGTRPWAPCPDDEKRKVSLFVEGRKPNEIRRSRGTVATTEPDRRASTYDVPVRSALFSMLAGGARNKGTAGGRGSSRLRTLDRTVVRSLLRAVGAVKRRRPLPSPYTGSG